MPWAGLEPLDLADREKLIADWQRRWQTGEDFNFGVFENGRLVGGCGLHSRIGPGGLEIRYWTRAGETGRGIASEAVRCLVGGAFSMSGVEFVEVHHDVANVAMLAVAADAASNDEDVPDTFPAEARLAINLILSRTDD